MKPSRLSSASAAVLLAGMALLGCGRTHASPPDPAHDAGASSADSHSPEPGSIVVVDPQMLAALTVDTVRDKEMPRSLVVAGKVQFDEDRLARVLAPLAGQVVDLRVKVGDAVRKGQALCAISSREAAAAIGEHIESTKDLDLAEKTYAMTQDLFDHEAASRIALQQAQSDLAKARSRAARTAEALRVLGLRQDSDVTHFNGRVPLPSPLTGTVIERRVTEGQFVQTDSTPMITVGDLTVVWILGDIFERDLHLVTAGQQAAVTAAAYGSERFQGRVSYISDVIDPATRTVKVRISVPNPRGRLKPEMFASVALGVGGPERVLTVPVRAVFTEDGRTWVYVATGSGRFTRRAVDLAQDDGSERRVLRGLQAGEQVVVGGALLLRGEEEKRAG
jgi:cobalt-zinc-cadmium efflux system membrane fusion protein